MKSMKVRKAVTMRIKGFTAIELIIVIGVMIIGLAIAASRGDMVLGSADTMEGLGDVQSLFASTRAMKSTTGYGAAGTNLVPALINTNGVPKNMTISGGQLFNSSSGVVTVVSTGPGFTITSNNLPRDLCIKQVTQTSRGGAMQTQINSGTSIAGEVSANVANTQCISGNNTVAWTSLK